MNKIFKSKKGITLVALVITIIILLILAGITISQLSGSGLFEKAKLAEQKSKEAQNKENGILSEYESLIDGGYRANKEYNAQIHDEWTTWLHLAGIENPEQYDKGKIVENEALMTKLLNSNAAVDYMLESTDFIMIAVCDSETALNCIVANENARKRVLKNSSWIAEIEQEGFGDKFDEFATKVPVATITTENMIYSSELSNLNRKVYHAFDNTVPTSGWSDINFFVPKEYEEDSYIGYNFNEPISIYKFSLSGACYENNTNQYAFVLQGLNEDGTWENIGDEYITNFTAAKTHTTKNYYINTSKEYYGYRIKNNYSTSGNGNKYWHVGATLAFAITGLQFYCTK